MLVREGRRPRRGVRWASGDRARTGGLWTDGCGDDKEIAMTSDTAYRRQSRASVLALLIALAARTGRTSIAQAYLVELTVMVVNGLPRLGHA